MKNLWDFICILGLLLKLLFVLLERAVTGKIIRHFKSKELLEIGTQLTFYYFLLFLVFFGWRIPELYANETGINGVGDFLAGLFSPIAFGWLIIGYLMQNKELRSSVEQTAEAQKLANDQLEFQKKIRKEEKILLHNNVQPSFIITSLEIIKNESGRSLVFEIENIKHTAYSVYICKYLGRGLFSAPITPAFSEISKADSKKFEIENLRKFHIEKIINNEDPIFAIGFRDGVNNLQRTKLLINLEYGSKDRYYGVVEPTIKEVDFL